MSFLSGPAFRRSHENGIRSVHNRDGGHYNTFHVEHAEAMRVLREFFPDGKADEMNFVLFSTSGVHGSYVTLDEIAAGLEKYGDSPEFEDDEPSDYAGNDLTFLIVQPRVVSLYYGNVTVTLDDIPYLKRLRETSRLAVQKIG